MNDKQLMEKSKENLVKLIRKLEYLLPKTCDDCINARLKYNEGDCVKCQGYEYFQHKLMEVKNDNH